VRLPMLESERHRNTIKKLSRTEARGIWKSLLPEDYSNGAILVSVETGS
jgi:hypothetical protein